MKPRRRPQPDGAGKRSARGHQGSGVFGGRGQAETRVTVERLGEPLEERARELALPEKPPVEPALALEWIEFEAGGWRFGLELACVAEVTALEGLTPVPGAPAWLRGIVNLRGQIHSVMDLETLLGLGEEPAAQGAPQVLVLGDPEVRLGLLAWRVEGLRGEALAALRPVGDRVSPVQAAFFRGASPDGVFVLEAGRLLGVARQPWGGLERGAGL